MADPDNPAASGNSGRHRAPDGEAQTAYIPRITDASPDGVPGGPLAPPVGLGTPATPPARPVSAPPPQPAPHAAPLPPAPLPGSQSLSDSVTWAPAASSRYEIFWPA